MALGYFILGRGLSLEKFDKQIQPLLAQQGISVSGRWEAFAMTGYSIGMFVSLSLPGGIIDLESRLGLLLSGLDFRDLKYIRLSSYEDGETPPEFEQAKQELMDRIVQGEKFFKYDTF